MSNIVIAQATKLAQTLGMAGEGRDLVETLKATAFKGQVTDAQMTALLLVANQYGLSPWTKEIYAFPDKGGIVPVVGVDGWARIINTHPQFDGIEFEQDEESCTCVIYRKDRSRPIKVTEYMAECKRGTQPWMSHPKRMLRHKATIQCARLAFGYGGIHDAEEAQQIVGTVNPDTGEITHTPAARPALEAYPADRFADSLPKWRELVHTGKKTPAQILAMLGTRAELSAEQRREIEQLDVVDVHPAAAPEPEAEADPQDAEDDFVRDME